MGRWALDVAFAWKAVLTLGLVLLYYCFSIGITFYNKWLTRVTGRKAYGTGVGWGEWGWEEEGSGATQASTSQTEGQSH